MVCTNRTFCTNTRTNTRANTRTGSSCGFTLLELLLAMTIGAIIAASSLAMMRSGLLAQRVARESVGLRCEGFLAVDAIAASLESAIRPGGILAGDFSGEDNIDDSDDPLSFYTISAPGDWDEFGGDIVRVEFVLEDDSSYRSSSDTASRRLVRYTYRNLLSSSTQDGENEIIARGITSLTLGYFDGDSWYDSWDSSAQDGEIPVSVVITLTITDQDKSDDDRSFKKIRRIVNIASGSDVQEQLE